jgi:hypothetical protein
LKNEVNSKNTFKHWLDLKHITILVIMLILFIFVVMIIQRFSVHSLLKGTQRWYRQHFAELLANTNATSLELLSENINDFEEITPPIKNHIIQSFNIILTQQTLDRNINDLCLIVFQKDSVYAIDNGKELLNFLLHKPIRGNANRLHKNAVKLFKENYRYLLRNEKIVSVLKKEKYFDILVPFTPQGELLGAFYMESSPNFSSITSEFLSNYNQIALIFISLILLGLLTMYYLTSYSVQEKEKTQQRLFEEQRERLKSEVEHQKESIFTKRIYHTHHKAEKIMGFIKEDLYNLNEKNIKQTKDKIIKYANFVARAIYDMKWYDPPIQTIRNPIFNTDINKTIKFIVRNIFLRVSSKMEGIKYNLELDENLPPVKINEFVIWEIIEPLIQNSIDHSPDRDLTINIKTEFNSESREGLIIIGDDGDGFKEGLLVKDEAGVQKIFYENVSTKDVAEKQAGYGCYIAYEMAVKKCGWQLTAENLETGCRFLIKINNL